MKITIKSDLSLEVFLPGHDEVKEMAFFKGEELEVEVLNIQEVAPDESYITVQTSAGMIIPDLLKTQNEFIDFEG
jgi:hypothetical protein